MRRLLCAAFLALAAPAVFAADVTAAWVAQLRLDGYDDIEVSRTWLGRSRIVAEKGKIEREIILNPVTGEVLRDYSRHEDGTLRLPLGFEIRLEDHDDSHERDDD